jgi:hypothetical protein
VAFLVENLFDNNSDHDDDSDQNDSDDDEFHGFSFRTKLGPSGNSFSLFENFPKIAPLIPKFASLSNLPNP